MHEDDDRSPGRRGAGRDANVNATDAGVEPPAQRAALRAVGRASREPQRAALRAVGRASPERLRNTRSGGPQRAALAAFSMFFLAALPCPGVDAMQRQRCNRLATCIRSEARSSEHGLRAVSVRVRLPRRANPPRRWPAIAVLGLAATWRRDRAQSSATSARTRPSTAQPRVLGFSAPLSHGGSGPKRSRARSTNARTRAGRNRRDA